MDANLSEIENVYLKIQNYSNPTTLLFKVPNRFGNIEIKYYTLLTFFINFLTLEIRKNISNSNNIIIQNEENEENEIDINSTSDVQIYFNFYQKKKGTTIKVDLTEFTQRKNELDKSLEKYAINEEKKKLNKTSSKKSINYLYNKLKDNINRLRIFKKRIEEMIYESDDLIIKKIKFIYYGILFPKEGSLDLLSKYNNCLNTNQKKESAYIEKYAKKEDCLAYDNLDGKHQDTINNPFYYNACYYKFPTLLKKNIIQNDNVIYKDFIQYLKYIYSSKIMKDIYYLSSEFNEFAYPLEDDEIFNEMLEYTVFVPFDGKILRGYTQKELPEVLISVYILKEYPKDIDISEIICELSQIINTCLHEQAKHYLKSLIFYNSFRFGIKKRINSNLFDYEEENKYIKGILKKYGKCKNFDFAIDCGEKLEIYLYGNILEKIYFSQSFELFKFSHWNKSIIEHIEMFLSSYNLKDNILEMKYTDIRNDHDICDFLKSFIFKFIQAFNQKRGDKNQLIFDLNSSAGKIIEKGFNEIDSDSILFNLKFSVNRGKMPFHDSSF